MNEKIIRRRYHKGEMLDEPPRELMLIEDDTSTDPYNSGVYRALRQADVVFIRDGKAVRGDTSTVDDGPLS